jgi:hypothetical protein
MATIALAAAGAAAGSALLPAGVTLLGTTLSGAAIGSQIGALVGSYVDQSLLAPSGQGRTLSGPRLPNLQVTASTEGAPIPRVYGSFRLGGQVIWATDIEEVATTTTQPGGRGKGRSRGSASARPAQVEYTYFANIAVALAEGPISGIGRVWADGQEFDLAGVTWRLHTGTEDQLPDSLIASHEGSDAAPAYRGLAYIVLEHLPLAPHGNRIPQLSFEVHRAVDELHKLIRGVVLIPGSGEFVYAPEPVTRLGEGGQRLYENVHTRQGGTDWQVSLDQLEASLPNARSVSLIVSWFGTDLRAGHCELKPGVELLDKENAPDNWSVAGLARADAHLISHRDGRPAYGGTPADSSVMAAIADLKARGLDVIVTPFILMDVPEGNALTDPYTGGAGQPAYPWRGRITVDPAPGRAGTPDKTAAAAAQVASLVGTASAGDFAIVDGSVAYTGPDEWTLRRQVLHYAWLAKAAGGVDAFVIGTELRGLSQIRSAVSTYPFVAALVTLAADVKSVLGPATKVTYAADWSEYFGHQPQDGTGDVHFHLDPLWASAGIDAVGIDLYWPLADWRDEAGQLDAAAGARSTYDLAYLKGNIAGGEGYDWYYASAADRASQTRTPITDGVGKPWVFRSKDVRSWWLNQHFNRPGGIENTTPTAWVPQSKPVWLMEIGCPAVDKGANQPNVFVDPKSSENALPYYSSGRRDDLIQRRYLQALVEGLDPDHPGAVAGLNPTSVVYGGPMIDTSRIHVYAWDARPFPAFPDDTVTWGDGGSWQLGHWLNGRLAAAPLSEVVGALLTDSGFLDYDASRLEGIVAGYAIDRIMSAREALQPLQLAYFFDAIESEGRIALRHRGSDAAVASLNEDGLVVERRAAAPLTLIRGQESELPSTAKLAYVNAHGSYRQAIAEARRLSSGSGRVAQAEVAVVMTSDQAAAVAETWLYESWTARERARFTLPPSHIAIEPGDTIVIEHAARERAFRVAEIADRGEREVDALAIDAAVYRPPLAAVRPTRAAQAPIAGLPLVEMLDLPLLRTDDSDDLGWVAATQSPWPGGIAFYSSAESTGFRLAAIAPAPATMGTLLDPLASGPTGRLDTASVIHLRLDHGELASVTHIGMLGGANVAAIRTADGDWEVVQFEIATLVAPGTYVLRGLLRGQAGTETAMLAGFAAGARFVLLDTAVTPISLGAEAGLPLIWRYGPADRDLGEESFDSRVHAFRGVGRRPLSPVHVRGTRDPSNGDLTLTWIRRTRGGGDGWDGIDVPLGEESEIYEVDVLNGTSAVRTLTTTASQAIYTGAQQIEDFGGLQSGVQVRVHQVNAAWGRGSPASRVV